MSAQNITVEAPKIRDRYFIKPLLCGPGPCDVWPSVAEALTRPVISPMCNEYFHVIDDIRAGIQYIFQTQSKLVVAMSGSGHAGMEAIITNLLDLKETLLIASRGIWDLRAESMALRYGIKVEKVSVPFNATFSLNSIEDALKRTRPAALFITHGDSSTGSLQNLEGLGELCHKYGALLLVDTVVSLVGVPFYMDEWKVDAVYTSTQKALSGPAGISPLALSPLAEKKMNSKRQEPPFYYDLKLLSKQWNCYGPTKQYHHTLSPPLLWALRRCLQEVCNETLPKAWARHQATTDHFHQRLQGLPLTFLVPKPKDRLVTVTTLQLPQGYDYLEFVKLMRARHNILIFAGLGPTAGKALRVGLMGVNSTIEVADAVADAMIDTLRAITKSNL